MIPYMASLEILRGSVQQLQVIQLFMSSLELLPLQVKELIPSPNAVFSSVSSISQTYRLHLLKTELGAPDCTPNGFLRALNLLSTGYHQHHHNLFIHLLLLLHLNQTYKCFLDSRIPRECIVTAVELSVFVGYI